MSIADNARQLLAASSQDEAKAMCTAIEAKLYALVEVSANLLGETHMGQVAIEGNAARVAESCEQLRAALNVFEFTIQNVAHQIVSEG